MVYLFLRKRVKMKPLLFILAATILLILYSRRSQATFSFPSAYGYRCTADKCVREERNFNNTGELLEFSSCCLTCGAYGTLWPVPTTYTRLSKETALFSLDNLQLRSVQAPDAEVEKLFREAWPIFKDNLKAMAPKSSSLNDKRLYSPVPSHQVLVDVSISRADSYLFLGTSEVYTLNVISDMAGAISRVSIIGATFFGARHGLETLSQLIAYNAHHAVFEIVNKVAIVDEPVYPYRGLLLDTARNFYPVDTIKRTVDAMSANKLNTLHWHISDSQAFPLALKSLPKMGYYGSFSPEEIYSMDDLAEVVRYSRVRGVRVVPEIDAPAHVGAGWQWGSQEGMGELLACFNKMPWNKYCVGPPCGQLNIANPAIYHVLRKVYSELAAIFSPMELFHFGGDEINFHCWNTTGPIVAMMQEQGDGLSKAAYLKQWAKFQARALDLLNTDREKSVGIIWTSTLTSHANVTQFLNKKDYIIQVWSASSSGDIETLLRKGYRVILSPSDAWYLDCGVGSWVGKGLNWCSPFKPWQAVYSHSPREQAGGGQDFRSLVMGGEVAAWSEQIDAANIDSRVWPRASAFAERVWSEPSQSWEFAEERILHQRKRLVERGVKADRLKPEWCRHYEGQCKAKVKR